MYRNWHGWLLLKCSGGLNNYSENRARRGFRTAGNSALLIAVYLPEQRCFSLEKVVNLH